MCEKLVSFPTLFLANKNYILYVFQFNATTNNSHLTTHI